MTTCPQCGHQFALLPKMTSEVKFKTGVLLVRLVKFAEECGQKISARRLGDLIHDACSDAGLMPYEMQTPRLYLQHSGVLRHAINGVGGSIRMLWEIDLEKAAELKEKVR